MQFDAYDALAIEAENLACERGGRRIFSGISFALQSAELLAITGPNGSGKSSLLRLLAGLVEPVAGSFRVTGGRSEAAVIHYLGHADALKPALTLRETLRFWRKVYGQQGGAPTGTDFDAAAEAVGLGHALDLRIGIFSAGQRKRAALARLLVSARPIWLLDEPTSSLDLEGETLLRRLMEDHLAAGGLIMAATHDELPIRPHRRLDLGGVS